MKASTRNKTAGNLNIAKGETKQAVGKVVASPNLRAKGAAQELVGRIQKGVGQAQKEDGY